MLTAARKKIEQLLDTCFSNSAPEYFGNGMSAELFPFLTSVRPILVGKRIMSKCTILNLVIGRLVHIWMRRIFDYIVRLNWWCIVASNIFFVELPNVDFFWHILWLLYWMITTVNKLSDPFEVAHSLSLSLSHSSDNIIFCSCLWSTEQSILL